MIPKRYVVCLLLVLATMVNLFDSIVVKELFPFKSHAFHLVHKGQIYLLLAAALTACISNQRNITNILAIASYLGIVFFNHVFAVLGWFDSTHFIAQVTGFGYMILMIALIVLDPWPRKAWNKQ